MLNEEEKAKVWPVGSIWFDNARDRHLMVVMLSSDPTGDRDIWVYQYLEDDVLQLPPICLDAAEFQLRFTPESRLFFGTTQIKMSLVGLSKSAGYALDFLDSAAERLENVEEELSWGDRLDQSGEHLINYYDRHANGYGWSLLEVSRILDCVRNNPMALFAASYVLALITRVSEPKVKPTEIDWEDYPFNPNPVQPVNLCG